MKKSVLIIFVLLSWSVYGQAEEKPKVDSLSQFRYLYKGEPMPFDSGVAVSHAQYVYLFTQSIFTGLDAKYQNAEKPVPKIVYVDREKRRKGDGKIWVWLLAGLAGGVAAGFGAFH
jgi:hypothetical protein